MKVSYIVSAYETAKRLPVCVHSLLNQTDADFEILVADNSLTKCGVYNILDCIHRIGDPRIVYVPCHKLTCYHSAEMVGTEIAQGDFLVFPSDDSYYMPVFGERMLRAADHLHADLVYCNMVYDGRGGGIYSMWEVEPRLNKIDKTGFMLRRSWFKGFPNKPDKDVPCDCDGRLIEQLISDGIKQIKIPDVLVVHN